MTATPSQEWTEESERWLEFYSGLDSEAHGVTCKLAREILRQRDEVARLRAENERLNSRIMDLESDTVDAQVFRERQVSAALRSQLAATREGETPDGDDGGVPRFENGDPLDEAMYAEWKSSRSRVSDNGK